MVVVALIAALIILYGFFINPELVMSVDSPDGKYEAYVIDNPSFDPPNQSLFVKNKGSDSFNLVEILAEDVDFIKKSSLKKT